MDHVAGLTRGEWALISITQDELLLRLCQAPSPTRNVFTRCGGDAYDGTVDVNCVKPLQGRLTPNTLMCLGVHKSRVLFGPVNVSSEHHFC